MNIPWIALLQEVLQRPLLVVSLPVLFALAFIFILSLVNSVTFPRLKPERPKTFPRVSMLIPARNEAGNIQSSLSSLLAQDYPNFEILLLDDHSEDATCSLAQETAGGDERFRLVKGEHLPVGWLGKNWACHQLARQAVGDVLVFTDADIRWKPGALSALIAGREKHAADVLTVWPDQETVSPTERMVIPMMMLVVLGYLPEIFVRFLPIPLFAAANGQCLAFTRPAYARIGGHAAVSDHVVEDVALSRLAKRSRLKLVMSLGSRLIHGRMYQDWHGVRRGFAKNILAGHASSPLFLVFSALFHWSLFVFPWIWLLLGSLGTRQDLWPAFPAAMIILGLGARAVTAVTAGLRLVDVIWLPVSVLLMTLIAVQALLWHFRDGGPQWKGRLIAHNRGLKPKPGEEGETSHHMLKP